jgi:hypothetical protein
MRSKDFRFMASIGVLVLALGIGALAQTPTHGKFRGVFQ